MRSLRFIPPGLALLLLLAAHPGAAAGATETALPVWERVAGPPGGTIVSFVSLNGGDSLLAASCGGGVFRSGDFGRTWSFHSSRLGNHQLQCLARDERGLLFAGTFAGVYRSVDGGGSWARGSFPERVPRVRDLLLLPAGDGPPGATRVIAATDDGIFRSEDRGQQWQLAEGTAGSKGMLSLCRLDDEGAVLLAGSRSGIFRSDDGGRSWQVQGGGLERISVWDILFDDGPSLLYAASSRGVFRSGDGGSSWSNAWLGLEGVGVYCLYREPGSGRLFAGSNGKGVAWHSGSGSAPWELSGEGLPDPTVRALAWLPGSEGSILAATANGVARSEDKGVSWVPSSDGLGSATVWWLEEVPWDDGRRLYIGSSNGVYYTTNWDAPEWIFAGPAPGVGHIWSLQYDYESGRLFAAGKEGVYLSDDGGEEWTLATEGLGAIRVNMLATFAGGNLLAASSGRSGGVYLGSDGGESWRGPMPGTERANVYPVLVSPGSDQVALAGTYEAEILKTSDGGESWTRVWKGERVGVKDLAVDRNDGKLVYAALSGGGVACSRDFGEHWELMNEGLPTRFVRSAVTGLERGTVYVGSNDYGVIVSKDAGGDWKPMGVIPGNRSVWRLYFEEQGPRLWAGSFSGGLFRISLE